MQGVKLKGRKMGEIICEQTVNNYFVHFGRACKRRAFSYAFSYAIKHTLYTPFCLQNEGVSTFKNVEKHPITQK